MSKFDTHYQAFRRDQLHKLSNMDSDDIIYELGVETDLLMDVLWFRIEEYIQTKYEEEYGYGEEKKVDEDDFDL